MAVMSTPVMGPLAPWHLVLLALLAYRFMGGGGGGGRKVAASHILVKEEEVCEKLKAELAGKAGDAEALGSAFAALAAEHSTCLSGKRGGALGEFGPGQMVPAFDKVCWGHREGRTRASHTHSALHTHTSLPSPPPRDGALCLPFLVSLFSGGGGAKEGPHQRKSTKERL